MAKFGVMKDTRLTVGDVKCLDVDGKTMGLVIGGTEGMVTLLFNRASNHKQMDALAAEIWKLGPSEVIFEGR